MPRYTHRVSLLQQLLQSRIIIAQDHCRHLRLGLCQSTMRISQNRRRQHKQLVTKWCHAERMPPERIRFPSPHLQRRHALRITTQRLAESIWVLRAAVVVQSIGLCATHDFVIT